MCIANSTQELREIQPSTKYSTQELVELLLRIQQRPCEYYLQQNSVFVLKKTLYVIFVKEDFDIPTMKETLKALGDATDSGRTDRLK